MLVAGVQTVGVPTAISLLLIYAGWQIAEPWVQSQAELTRAAAAAQAEITVSLRDVRESMKVLDRVPQDHAQQIQQLALITTILQRISDRLDMSGNAQAPARSGPT
jgi:hypothetical protein